MQVSLVQTDAGPFQECWAPSFLFASETHIPEPLPSRERTGGTNGKCW